MRYHLQGIWERERQSNESCKDSIGRLCIKWCRTCEQCQKHSAVKNLRAPLVPLPVIKEPFTRIAMDIGGPLPQRSTGNKHILVVCNYATRYLEPIPMKTVDAEHVAEELVTMFTRVGVPTEILMDQGTNFMS